MYLFCGTRCSGKSRERKDTGGGEKPSEIGRLRKNARKCVGCESGYGGCSGCGKRTQQGRITYGDRGTVRGHGDSDRDDDRKVTAAEENEKAA